METEAQLAWERRLSRPAAAAAFGAVLLLLASSIAQGLALRGSNDERELLVRIDSHHAALLASSILQAIGSLLIGVALFYLFGATRHRRKELPLFAVYVIPIGFALTAASGIVLELQHFHAADQFLASGPRSLQRAKDIYGNRGTASIAVGAPGAFAVAATFVLVSVNAMRAGLLSRLMGSIGIALGVTVVLLPPVGGILELFWVAALGVLYLGFWPGGRGPAWESGRAEPWPSAAELRMAAEEPAPAEAAEPAPAPSRKRKRKRRR